MGFRVARMDSAAPPGSPVSPTRDKGETEVRDEGSTVGKSDTLAEVKKAVPSWLSVAQDKKVLKKFEVEVTNRGDYTRWRFQMMF